MAAADRDRAGLARRAAPAHRFCRPSRRPPRLRLRQLPHGGARGRAVRPRLAGAWLGAGWDLWPSSWDGRQPRSGSSPRWHRDRHGSGLRADRDAGPAALPHRPWLAGAIYGLILYPFMYLVVLPLRFPETFPAGTGSSRGWTSPRTSASSWSSPWCCHAAEIDTPPLRRRQRQAFLSPSHRRGDLPTFLRGLPP